MNTNHFTTTSNAPPSFGHSESAGMRYDLEVGQEVNHEIAIPINTSEHLANEFEKLKDPVDSEAFLQDAALIASSLPYSIRRAIDDFARFGNAAGVLLIRGLPVDHNVPATPLDPNAKVTKKTKTSEASLAMVGSMLGYLIGYAQERQGRLFHNLVPTAANASTLSSESSKVALDLHTENAFHPFGPDWLMLAGVRTDRTKTAKTTFAGIRNALSSLSMSDRFELSQKAFASGIDVGYGNIEATPGLGPVVEVLYGDPGDPFLRYDWDLMKCLRPNGKAALMNLRLALQANTSSVLIEPGTLLVIDNRRAAHGRTVFRAEFDGEDRWIQRVNVTRDLNKSRSDRSGDSRVIATDFSPYLK